MLARKTLRLLASLTARQQRDFSAWMASPVHNTDAGLQNLAVHLLRIAPAYAPPEAWQAEKGERPHEQDLGPGQLWSVLYPERPLKEGVLRVKIRQLTRQAEDFIAYQQLRADDTMRDLLLLRGRRSTMDYPAYEKLGLRTLGKLQRDAASGPETFLATSQIRTALSRHPDFDASRGAGAHLRELDGDLDAWFALRKYRLMIQRRNRARLLGEDSEQRFLPDIRQQRAGGLLPDHPAAHLYELLSDVLDAPGAPPPDALHDSFAADHHRLPTEDRQVIFYTALNYLSRRINEGDDRFFSPILDWYTLGLTSGILLRDGRVSATTFSNITLLGYRAGRSEWTDRFVEQYAHLLPPALRRETMAAARGTGAFFRGDYTEALNTLMPLTRAGRSLRLRTRLTVVRALYELFLSGQGEYEELERTVANFDQLLIREKALSPSVTTPYRSHLRYLLRLARLNIRGQTTDDSLEALRKDVVAQPGMMAREWLLEKIKTGE